MDAGVEPLFYHRMLRDFLKQEEPALWAWFASKSTETEYLDQIRLDLLKATYRLDRESHGELHRLADEVLAVFDLGVPVTLYQSTEQRDSGAFLCYAPREIHLVFAGQVLEHLDDREIKSLIGHEFAHYVLWELEDGDYLTTDRALLAMANDPRAEASHFHSARRYQLYTEIFADRGSAMVVDDPQVAVSALVKVMTGLEKVSAAAYLKQADEILLRDKIKTDGVTHPEAYIRARAVNLWSRGELAADEVDVELRRMIQGPLTLNEMDLLDQQKLTTLTRRLLGHLLSREWLRTDRVMGHAHLFFSDMVVRPDPDCLAECCFEDPRLQEYLCYLLLDFGTVDPDLEENALAATWRLAGEIGLADCYDGIIAKELRMNKRQLAVMRKAAEAMADEEASS